MYIDKLLELADAQALTATGNTTNVIDLGSDRDVGNGKTLWLVLSLDVATDGVTGDETYVFTLTTDDNSSFSSATTILTITVPRSTAAGTRYAVAIPSASESAVEIESASRCSWPGLVTIRSTTMSMSCLNFLSSTGASSMG